jgi:hypothetical protein
MKRSILALGLTLISLSSPAATVTVGEWTPVFKGIELATGQQVATVGTEPNLRLFCYRVDLTDPDVVLMGTPKCTNCGAFETLAQNTSGFLEETGVQVAINGGFYSDSFGPTDQPVGTPVSVRGLAFTKGIQVSAADDPTYATALIFAENNAPSMVLSASTALDTTGVYTAISGNLPLLTNGVIAQNPIPNDRDPRTAVGISEDKRYLFLMTVDGRQAGWSDGADWYTTGEWLKRFGAHEGINVDGGGSTTMAMADCQGKAVRLNRPSFVAAYGRERNVGHNFGVYAPPLPSPLRNLQVDAAGATATITWETDSEATTQVEYGPTTAYGSATTFDGRLKRRHVATIAGLSQGSNYFFKAISSSGEGTLIQECRFTTATAASRTTLFGLSQVWKYTTNNLDGVNWKAASYNDSGWTGQGAGLLYVQENSAQVSPRTTQMPPTSGTPPRTYYFRTHFNFSGSTEGLSLQFSNYVDDGAVFYLNGTEIQRLRMQAAPIVIANNSAAIGTPCAGTAQAGDAAAICPDVFTITGTQLASLAEGDNVLAVEVHNATGADLVFGSALIQISAVQSAPQLNIWAESGFTTLFWNGAGFTLQQSTDLGAPANWADLSGATASPVTITNGASTYFRLRN